MFSQQPLLTARIFSIMTSRKGRDHTHCTHSLNSLNPNSTLVALKIICFDHDPRNGKSCQNKDCLGDPSKQHLDTRQTDQATRYDRAKALYNQNKESGKHKG